MLSMSIVFKNALILLDMKRDGWLGRTLSISLTVGALVAHALSMYVVPLLVI